MRTWHQAPFSLESGGALSGRSLVRLNVTGRRQFSIRVGACQVMPIADAMGHLKSSQRHAMAVYGPLDRGVPNRSINGQRRTWLGVDRGEGI
jgi:hypothetical protein